MHEKEAIIEQLTIFGLSSEAASLYLILLNSGPSGIIAIAKMADIGRNVAYRLLSELENKQIITVSKKSFGKEYTALHPSVLEGIIADKEALISQMRGVLPGLTTNLEGLISGQNQPAKIIHYKGLDGLKQMNWHLTKAKKEFRVFEVAPVSDYLDRAFSEKLRRLWAQNQVTTYDLTNRKSIPVHTNELEYWLKFSKHRYIDPSILAVKYEMYIYNDAVALLNYQTDIPHGVEVYDQALSHMQRQLFDTIWAQAQEMKTEASTNRRYVEEKP